ncbi:Serine protease 38 [Galemys pyrenaicus]|uniref:tryptase n=1 Tax=Galemys pyrenaicus TaxID=202257 RepID=A0A8J5ZY86_GALPY|nr:Serine protease 38 [Galemys pyrenaicus]
MGAPPAHARRRVLLLLLLPALARALDSPWPLAGAPPASPRPARAPPSHPRAPAPRRALPSSACGQRGGQGRVIGGADAPERRWPWQASVHYLGLHICGGSVVHAYWVLSAAHCFGRHMNVRALDVYVGLVDLEVAGRHTQWFEVHQVILHPTFQMYHPVGGDIALVQLKSRIVFSDSVHPICLPPPGMKLLNLSCWATGWGLKSQKGDTSTRLQEAPMPLIPVFLCQLLHGHFSYILPDMLCAGDLHNTKTVCEGDSGGPLVCEIHGRWTQVGVVSWGRGCTYPMYPAVYARVSHFSAWIGSQVARTPLPPQPLPARASALGAAVPVLAVLLAVRSAH